MLIKTKKKMLNSINILKYAIICSIISVTKHVRVSNFVPLNRQEDALQVVTSDGIIQGELFKTISNKHEYYSFRGIPFAEPPVEELRFRDPVQKSNWSKFGILDATKEPYACMQDYALGITCPQERSEDCLYLSIFTPKNFSVTNLLPVVVWFYGGAFLAGCAVKYNYGPDYFIEENVIVVTVNYRLGVYGFLSTGDDACPGNMGLKDQTLALKWIQKNIKQFGGNPNLITIDGQSAGGSSVHFQMLSPSSEGLFHRVIAQSGVAIARWTLQKDAKEISFMLGNILGISTSNSTNLIAKLRSSTNEELLLAQEVIFTYVYSVTISRVLPFAPVLEHEHSNAFITKSPYGLLETGNFQKVPFFTGVVSNEGGLYSIAFPFVWPILYVFDLFPSLLSYKLNIKTEFADEVGKRILEEYSSTKTASGLTQYELFKFLTDDYYIRPARKSIQLMSKYSPVYAYKFSYESQYGLKGTRLYTERPINGTYHIEDVQFLYNNKRIPESTDPHDSLIRKRLIKLWTNFIKYGNPTPEQDPLLQNIILPAASPDDIKYVKIDRDISLENDFGHEDKMKFWDEILENYSIPPYDTF